MGAVEYFLTKFTPNTINNTFIFVMFAIFSIGILLKLKKVEKFNSFISYIPSLLTSIGIFGTFVGISIGLVNFEPSNIDKSISELLNGMKTAFYSSLVGIFFSIVFKIFSTINNNRDIEDDDSSIIMDIMEKQTKLLENISKIMGGESDTSVLNQVKLFKADFSDFSKYIKENNENFATELWSKMESFAEILSKSATEQIIQALNDVIKDFNNNLTEQFGDNFKQLNEAVLKLVEWQDNYKEQIELWQKNYDNHKDRIDLLQKQQEVNVHLFSEVAQSVEKVLVSIKEISERTEIIPETMKQLSNIMTIQQKQIDDLQKYLKAFADMKDKATTAFPEIKNNLEEIIESIQKMVEKSTTYYNELVNKTSDIENKIDNMVNVFLDKQNTNINKIFTSLNQTLQENTKNINNTIESNLKDMLVSQNKGIDALFSKIDKTLQEQVSKTADSIDRQVKVIDETMEQELKRGLESIGKALAQIATKVVEEYNKMRIINS